MKKIQGIVWLVIVIATICFLYRARKPAAIPVVAPASAAAPGQPGNPSAPPNNSAASTLSPSANSTSPPLPAMLSAKAGMVEPAPAMVPVEMSPGIVIQNVRHAITEYGAMFGGNPVGTNPEITAALAGNNPKQINFIKPEAGMRINGNGELVDTWGTPLFFHQLSGTDTEVRSAGPDRKLWTPDDVVTR